MSLWFKGWDQAQSDHNLFTENQTLKAKNEQLEREHAGCMEENMFLVDDKSRLEIEISALKGDNDYLREVAIRCKEDKETFRKAAEIGYEKMDDIRLSLKSAITYIDDSSVLSFRREKIKALLISAEKECPDSYVRRKKSDKTEKDA
jgi:hypothetical protein